MKKLLALSLLTALLALPTFAGVMGNPSNTPYQPGAAPVEEPADDTEDEVIIGLFYFIYLP